MKFKQVLIAVDQVLNTIFGGWADETLSARSYRNDVKQVKRWMIARKVIDTIFFWQPNHCYQSYLSEAERSQLPAQYRELPK
jgi:hypothetical protein